MGNIVALAVDTNRGFLFWANNMGKGRGIYRSSLDGSDVTLIVKGQFTVVIKYQKL